MVPVAKKRLEHCLDESRYRALKIRQLDQNFINKSDGTVEQTGQSKVKKVEDNPEKQQSYALIHRTTSKVQRIMLTRHPKIH